MTNNNTPPLDELQQLTVDTIKSGEAVVGLFSVAGTGKSVIIQQVATPTTMVAAPTGIAALNAGGVTLHKLFKLPIGLITDKDYHLNSELKSLLRNTSTLILDECGMIRADQLDLINWKCRRATGIDKPFGGIQFVLVGDFFQLEPIVGYNEKRYYYEEYDTPFIFGSDIFKESNPKVIELTKVYRNENKKQVKILNSIRRKDKWYKHAIKMINDNSLPYDPDVEQLHLCCYKEDAQRINEHWYNKLQGVEWTYKAYSTGIWKDNEKIVPETVRLKLGCKVMICANDVTGAYVNGDKGVVKALYNDMVTVTLENGRDVHVTINMWEKFSYKSQGEGIDKVTEAEYNQIPIKLGWATTVHAAQGLTLDNIAIHLGRGCFSHGQLYVALSRVRDLRNISLVNKIKYSDCIVNDDVINFYKHLEKFTKNVE